MNTEELRIVRGNAFNIKIQVEAIRLDGTIIEHFRLADANAQLKVWHAGELTPKEFVVEDNNAIISFDGTQGLGWYGLEMSGTFEGAPWRFAVTQVFQIVETNEKANVPSWTILTDQTYFMEGAITMYASGSTYQADWDETDPTSPSYIKNKPNLGVYATKSQLHSTEQQLQHGIDQEESARKHADQTLQGDIDAEEARAKAAEKQNSDDIDAIEALIPEQASAQNQLADKNFVNNSISTSTATFRGTYNEVTDLELTTAATHAQIEAALATKIATADNNDYCFVQIPTATAKPTEIAAIERYKFNGTTWAYEYTLNNSGFTAAQWAAINSGITNADVVKLLALPTNSELTTLLNGKQDTISDLQTIREGAAAGATAYQKPAGGIPSTDMTQAVQTSLQKADNAAPQSEVEGIEAKIPAAASDQNQLADKNFVNSSIATATATYRGSYNVVSDLSLSSDATHAQIEAAIATKLAALGIVADNNDYCFVQIPTATATPTEIASIERYKFNGTAWSYEYTLNNSGFTSDQWAAINSGITSDAVAKLAALPTNAELTTLLNGKQDTISDLQTIRDGAAAGATALQPAALDNYYTKTEDDAATLNATRQKAVINTLNAKTQQTIVDTDLIQLYANDGTPNGKVSKADLMSIVKASLPALLSDQGVTGTDFLSIASGVLGKMTAANLASVLGEANGGVYEKCNQFASVDQGYALVKVPISLTVCINVSISGGKLNLSAINVTFGACTITYNEGQSCCFTVGEGDCYFKKDNDFVYLVVAASTQIDYSCLIARSNSPIVQCEIVNRSGFDLSSYTLVRNTSFPAFYKNYANLSALRTAIGKMEFVDMGLPSRRLWASKNIGAETITDYGYYFSWGNVNGHKPNGTTFDYDFGTANDGPYASTEGAALTGDIPEQQDAANFYLGGNCRMPTKEEFAELFNSENTKFIDATGAEVTGNNKLITLHGVVGIYLMSKVNGNKLFFPCAGVGYGSTLDSPGLVGYYWSKSYYSDANGYNLNFSSGDVIPQGSDNRFYGFSIRTVQ